MRFCAKSNNNNNSKNPICCLSGEFGRYVDIAAYLGLEQEGLPAGSFGTVLGW